MSKLQASFDDLLNRELTISTSQISQGSKSHNYIRDLLGKRNAEDNSFPRFVDGDFLSGSYARGTKIFPLDDIDVMMVIDGSSLFAVNNGSVLDAEVRGSGGNSNPILNYFGNDGLLDSRKVLDVFSKALSKSHPNSTISKHGQAINVWLDSYNMGIDIVPCFHILPRDGSQDFYYIPQGEGSAGWMTTNPKIDERITDNLHETHNKSFKGVVRIVKYWNKISNAGRLRSYHIETSVWHAFDKYSDAINTYEQGLARFFQHAPDLFSGVCADKTNLGGPVDSYLDTDMRSLSVSKANEAITHLREAYLHPQSNDELKLNAWKKLLGNKFIF